MNFYQRGFTLIEIAVVAVIISLIGVESAMLAKTSLFGSKQSYSALENSDTARITAFRFLNEIRNATAGNDGSYAINKADDFEIVFYSTFRAGASLVNRIRYYISENTLYKGVIEPAGNPLAYNLASEKISIVQRDLANGANPLFYYYDGDYDGTAGPLSQPVNLTQIKFVRINLMVLKQTTQGSLANFSLNIGSAIRSLKTNLGS